MRQKIQLDTMKDISAFVAAMAKIKHNVIVEDNDGHRVNAKSMLGMIYSLEFDDLFCVCDADISGALLPFMAE